ncbi:MAG: DUF5668 domain-containing protein [bacterium]
MFIGIVLMAIGVLMILDKTGIIHGSFWDYLLPVALIALGVDFVFGRRRKQH